MNKIEMFTAPWGARLFICSTWHDIMNEIKKIKSDANYVPGATLRQVIQKNIEKIL